MAVSNTADKGNRSYLGSSPASRAVASRGQPARASERTLAASIIVTTPAGGGTSGALPAQLAYVVAQAHAQVVELYPQEWLVADGPAWPTFAQSHEAYAQGLARAASEVGG